MDQHKLRTLVFEKTGVKIDVDDPIFALVALNEAVLAEAVERHVALLDEATASLAGALGAAGVKLAAAPAPAAARQPAMAGPQARREPLLVAGAAALVGAILVLLGQALFFRPAPAPAPVVITKELTAEQLLALKNAEKLNKIIAKMDGKTRATIQGELQKLPP